MADSAHRITEIVAGLACAQWKLLKRQSQSLKKTLGSYAIRWCYRVKGLLDYFSPRRRN